MAKIQRSEIPSNKELNSYSSHELVTFLRSRGAGKNVQNWKLRDLLKMAKLYITRSEVRSDLVKAMAKLHVSGSEVRNDGRLPQLQPKVNGTPHASLILEKPKLSYPSMIVEALNQAENKMMPLEDIYTYISRRYPYHKMGEKSWQNSVRHVLRFSPCFYRVPNPINSTGRGRFWTTKISQNAEDKH